MSESEAVNDKVNEMYGVANTMPGTRSLPGTPHYTTSSPIVYLSDNYSNWNGMYYGPQGALQPIDYVPPDKSNKSYIKRLRSQSPQVEQMFDSQQQQQMYRFWDDRSKTRDFSTSEASNFRSVKVPPQGRSTQFPPQPEWNMPRLPWPVPINHDNAMFNQAHKRRSPSPMFMPPNPDMNIWNGQPSHIGGPKWKKSERTPSLYDMPPLSDSAQRSDCISPFRQSASENEEIENFFSPINSRNSNGIANSTSTPIELQVTNLDQRIGPKDIPASLIQLFGDYDFEVCQVSVLTQINGSHAAKVLMPSLSEAQKALSYLQNHQFGNERIQIKISSNGEERKKRKALSDVQVSLPPSTSIVVTHTNEVKRFKSLEKQARPDLLCEIIFRDPFYSGLPIATEQHKERTLLEVSGRRRRGPDYQEWESKAMIAYIHWYGLYGSAHSPSIWRIFRVDGFCQYRTAESLCSRFRQELIKNEKIKNFGLPVEIMKKFLSRQDEKTSARFKEFHKRCDFSNN